MCGISLRDGQFSTELRRRTGVEAIGDIKILREDAYSGGMDVRNVPSWCWRGLLLSQGGGILSGDLCPAVTSKTMTIGPYDGTS